MEILVNLLRNLNCKRSRSNNHYFKTENEQAIKALGAKPAVGFVEDVKFLNETFKDHDAVYTMVPPKWDAENWKEWIRRYW